MDANEIYERAIAAAGGAGMVSLWPLVRGVYGWLKTRGEERQREVEERAKETAEVKVAEIHAESESEARLWAEINQLRDRLDRQGAEMRAIQHEAINSEQKVIASRHIIESQEKEIARLNAEIARRDRQIEGLRLEMEDLRLRMVQLERRSP